MQHLDPIYFAPQRKADGSWRCFKDSPSPPPAPDYKGAAQSTSYGSAQAAIANNILNMRNSSNPLGSRNFTPSGNYDVPAIGDQPGFQIPTYSESVNMTPEGQNLYNKQMGLSTGLMNLGQASLDQVSESINRPRDMGSVGDIAERSYMEQVKRLDPQWGDREKQMQTRLTNQGLAPGGEAYDAEQRNFEQARNDAYGQARLSSIATMPQTYQLATALRTQPLTELAALRSGAQPQMPQFQAVPAAGGVQGPNMLGAAQAGYGGAMDQYNAGVGQKNAMMSGLFQLGAAGIGAYPWG